MNVFIVQPMSGCTNEEIKETRRKAERKIKEFYPRETVKIINGIFENYEPKEGWAPMERLIKFLYYMTDADLVVFCHGWERDRVARIAHKVANEYVLKHDYL